MQRQKQHIFSKQLIGKHFGRIQNLFERREYPERPPFEVDSPWFRFGQPPGISNAWQMLVDKSEVLLSSQEWARSNVYLQNGVSQVSLETRLVKQIIKRSGACQRKLMLDFCCCKIWDSKHGNKVIYFQMRIQKFENTKREKLFENSSGLTWTQIQI